MATKVREFPNANGDATRCQSWALVQSSCPAAAHDAQAEPPDGYDDGGRGCGDDGDAHDGNESKDQLAECGERARLGESKHQQLIVGRDVNCLWRQPCSLNLDDHFPLSCDEDSRACFGGSHLAWPLWQMRRLKP